MTPEEITSAVEAKAEEIRTQLKKMDDTRADIADIGILTAAQAVGSSVAACAFAQTLNPANGPADWSALHDGLADSTREALLQAPIPDGLRERANSMAADQAAHTLLILSDIRSWWKGHPIHSAPLDASPPVE
jgi:hypothetical protein